MTLFITTRTRQYEISDAYVMALSFLIFFAVGKVIKKVVQKQKQKRYTNMPNLRGGHIKFEIADDTELGNMILASIADNERYMVKNPEIIKLVFRLAEAKIKDESLILTPNMICFLAFKVIKKDKSLNLKIGNIVILSSNRARLFVRASGASIIEFLGAVAGGVPYAILMALAVFDDTENCGYPCQDYFEQLSKEKPIIVTREKSTGHLMIAGNDDARQIEVYNPLTSFDEVDVMNGEKLKKTRTYKKSKTKAKVVNFADFKKHDPVLSKFNDLEELVVPQKICPINNVQDAFSDSYVILYMIFVFYKYNIPRLGFLKIRIYEYYI